MLSVSAFNFFYCGWLDACGSYVEFGYVFILTYCLVFEYSANSTILTVVDCTDSMICDTFASGFAHSQTAYSNTSHYQRSCTTG